tara:strand:- start:448 stop:1641 length:1194 start_codon:yes stop_codon:yes gene_type:complete
MSKGGGGSPQMTESKQTVTNLPEYAEPYFTRLMQRGEAESLQPYRPYTDQRLAEQSLAAQRALARQTALGLSGSPAEMNQASNIARGVASAGSPTAGQDIARYDPTDITSTYGTERFTGFLPAQQYQSQDFDTDIAQRYMNPFQQMVTDIEKREAARQSGIMSKGIGDAATQQGGLGGYREAIIQAERERNLGQQLGDIQSRGQRDAFAQAQQQFERDRASRFGAAGFGEQQRQAMEQIGLSAQEMADRSRQFEASQRLAAEQADIDANIRARQLGLAGIGADQATQQQRLQSAQLLAAQGPMQQQLAFDRLKQAQSAQEIGRNFQQAGLDMAYQDYLNQLAYPRQQLGFQSQILQGLPVTPGTQVSSYQPQPTASSQLLGLGLGGLGLYRALGGGG